MATRLKSVDAVVIGVGWAGSIMATELAKAGLKVVGLERGRYRGQEEFTLPGIHDELKYNRRLELFEDLFQHVGVSTHTSSMRGLSMHAVIADKKAKLAELCRRYDVVRLEIFGSAARGTDFDPATSDADFLVEFDPNSDLPPLEQFFGLVDALSDALGRPVDLVENHEFRNPYLGASINEYRELVYAS